MISAGVLPDLPSALRTELLSEFGELIANFYEGRWRASGLNAGRFCEIAYCVVVGVADGEFAERTSKPRDFRTARKQFENRANLPHSFRFMIPVLLDALTEIRNNRNIGHVGGDVDPSFMDASLVIANARWIVAEFVRHFHKLSSDRAQSMVDSISQYTSPYVWSADDVRRVLRTDVSLDMKMLLLLSSNGGRASRAELFDWLDETSKSNFNKRIAYLHASRLVEAKAYGSTVQLLPPGMKRVAELSDPPVGVAA